MLYTDDAIRKRKSITNKIKNRIIAIVYVILVPLLIYNILFIVQAIVNPDETPSFFGIKTYVIISGSMMPELEIGDIVITKNVKQEELKVGDIISFRKGQVVVTHRISEVLYLDGKVQFRTKGDSNNVEDTETIGEEVIEGKVINKVPVIGKIVITLKNKIVIIEIIVFYYIYLLHNQNVQRRKNVRKIKREEYEKNRKQEKL